jgi:hypothetical protein
MRFRMGSAGRRPGLDILCDEQFWARYEEKRGCRPGKTH